MTKTTSYFTVILLCMTLLSAEIQASGEKPKASENEAGITMESINSPLDVPASLIGKVKQSKEQKDLAFHIAKGYAKEGDILRALLFISDLPESVAMHKKTLTVEAYSSYYVYHGREPLVKAVANLSEQQKDSIYERCIEDATGLNKQADVHFLFKEITSTPIKSRNAQLVLNFFLEQDKFGDASLYFNYILFPAQQDQAWASLSLTYARLDEIEALRQSVQNISNPRTKETLFSDLVELFSEKSNYNVAKEFATQLSDINDKEQALLDIINALVNDKRYREAVELSQTLTLNQHRERAILYLGISFASQGQFDSIDKALNQLETQALKNEYIDIVSLELAKADYVDEALALAAQLPDSEKLAVYSKLAYQLGLSSDFHFSFLVIQSFKDYALLNATLSQFSYALAKTEKENESLQVLESIKDASSQELTALRILTELDELQDAAAFRLYLSSPENTLKYYSVESEKLMTQESKDPDSRYLSELASFSKQSRLDKAYAIKASIYLLELQTLYGNDKDASSTLQRLYKRLKSAKDSLSFDDYKAAVALFVQRGERKKALELIHSYHNKDRQLFMFDVFSQESDYDKKDITAFKQFQKRFR